MKTTSSNKKLHHWISIYKLLKFNGIPYYCTLGEMLQFPRNSADLVFLSKGYLQTIRHYYGEVVWKAVELNNLTSLIRIQLVCVNFTSIFLWVCILKSNYSHYLRMKLNLKVFVRTKPKASSFFNDTKATQKYSAITFLLKV